jgi:hypothetical protein
MKVRKDESFYCAGQYCPGYSYKASDRKHPASCFTGDLDADDLNGSVENNLMTKDNNTDSVQTGYRPDTDDWVPAAWQDCDGLTDYWCVVDSTEQPHPVAICPRGKEMATAICNYKQQAEEYKAKNLNLLDEIEQWKKATGLEKGGDPDDVTPNDLYNEINHLRQQQEKNWGAADEAIRGQYEDRIKAERSVCVKFLRDCAKSKRDYANRLLSNTTQSKPQADVYERESAALESVAEVIENGKHWK